MALQTEFILIPAEELHALAVQKKEEGARFVQLLGVTTEQGIDVYYSFMTDGVLSNYCVKGVTKDMHLPSITDQFLAAFVFENETRELFGVDIRDIAIDFGGNLYKLAEKEPMTYISPEQLAAREKAKKVAAAAAAKAAKAEKEDSAKESAESEPKPAIDAELEKKLAAMDPEKAAKVRAAMEAKAKREAAKAAEEGGN